MDRQISQAAKFAWWKWGRVQEDWLSGDRPRLIAARAASLELAQDPQTPRYIRCGAFQLLAWLSDHYQNAKDYLEDAMQIVTEMERNQKKEMEQWLRDDEDMGTSNAEAIRADGVKNAETVARYRKKTEDMQAHLKNNLSDMMAGTFDSEGKCLNLDQTHPVDSMPGDVATIHISIGGDRKPAHVTWHEESTALVTPAATQVADAPTAKAGGSVPVRQSSHSDEVMAGMDEDVLAPTDTQRQDEADTTRDFSNLQISQRDPGSSKDGLDSQLHHW